MQEELWNKLNEYDKIKYILRKSNANVENPSSILLGIGCMFLAFAVLLHRQQMPMDISKETFFTIFGVMYVGLAIFSEVMTTWRKRKINKLFTIEALKEKK